MRPNENLKDSIVLDYMNLDTDGKKSFFYNAIKYERDSIYNVDKNLNALIRSKNYDRNLNYIVEKNYQTHEVNLFDRFRNINLVISEKETPTWKILDDFSIVNGISGQKAITNYKGRNWEAWFSKDYPFSDGPYKFSGLPGLIIKLKDLDNDHEFEIIQVKKINTIFDILPKSNRKITYKDYQKLINNSVFNANDDVESIHANPKAGTLGVQLKDGYVGHFNFDKLNRNKNIDQELGKLLKRSSNSIER